MNLRQLMVYVQFGQVNMHLYNFFLCGPKFTRFLLFNVGGVVVVQLRVRFLTCRPVPGTFAIKVESCQKSHRNLDVFWPSQILWGRPSKSYTHVMTPAWRNVVWKMFCGDTRTGFEVIGVHTLNFKANFKFSRLEFFFLGGDPRPTSGVRYQGLVNL